MGLALSRAVLVVLLLACAQASRGDAQTIAELEYQYTQGRNLEAAVKLHQMATLDADVIKWLAEKAEAGVPPFQYEYSRRLAPSDMPMAIRWFARGFVVRSLDFAECADRTQNPGYIAIAQLYSPLFDKVLAQPGLYATEAEQAIGWERQRAQRPSPQWICENRLLPSEQRQAARERQTAELRAGISRLRAKASSK